MSLILVFWNWARELTSRLTEFNRLRALKGRVLTLRFMLMALLAMGSTLVIAAAKNHSYSSEQMRRAEVFGIGQPRWLQVGSRDGVVGVLWRLPLAKQHPQLPPGRSTIELSQGKVILSWSTLMWGPAASLLVSAPLPAFYRAKVKWAIAIIICLLLFTAALLLAIKRAGDASNDSTFMWISATLWCCGINVLATGVLLFILTLRPRLRCDWYMRRMFLAVRADITPFALLRRLNALAYYVQSNALPEKCRGSWWSDPVDLPLAKWANALNTADSLAQNWSIHQSTAGQANQHVADLADSLAKTATDHPTFSKDVFAAAFPHWAVTWKAGKLGMTASGFCFAGWLLAKVLHSLYWAAHV